MNDEKKCGTCKWWVGPVVQSTEIGQCFNPSVPVGRSCKAAMFCNGWEVKDIKIKPIEPAEKFPLMGDEKPKELAIRMKIPEHSETFFIGDVIRISQIPYFKILAIEDGSFQAAQVDKQGNVTASPMWFKIGDFWMEKNYALTEQSKGISNGSGTDLHEQRREDESNSSHFSASTSC